MRVKGFVNVEGCQGPVVVQFVQHLAHPPVELDAWPDGNRQSRIVFITKNISSSRCEKAVRDVSSFPRKRKSICSRVPAFAEMTMNYSRSRPAISACQGAT